MLTQITEIERPIDTAQQVGSRHMVVDIERIKKLVLPVIQRIRHDGSISRCLRLLHRPAKVYLSASNSTLQP